MNERMKSETNCSNIPGAREDAFPMSFCFPRGLTSGSNGRVISGTRGLVEDPSNCRSHCEYFDLWYTLHHKCHVPLTSAQSIDSECAFTASASVAVDSES